MAHSRGIPLSLSLSPSTVPPRSLALSLSISPSSSASLPPFSPLLRSSPSPILRLFLDPLPLPSLPLYPSVLAVASHCRRHSWSSFPRHRPRPRRGVAIAGPPSLVIDPDRAVASALLPSSSTSPSQLLNY